MILQKWEHFIKNPSNPSSGLGRDLHGASQLVIDAVTGVTDIVEDMHRTIASLAPPIGAPRVGPASGISGLVYRSVRGITRAVGVGLDVSLRRLAPLLDKQPLPPVAREATLAALNGVLGDYLQASGNALAIRMEWRSDGRAFAPRAADGGAPAASTNKLVLLIHGLCMNDRQWFRAGHDHGAALTSLGYTPIYLRYNSGLKVADNGRQLAAAIDDLLAAWPLPVDEIVLLGHSMGGLVARSAIHYGATAHRSWLAKLKSLICLGTPHLGSPLERAGNKVDMLLGFSPYSAPFARLGMIRSAGIQDLRHGRVVDDVATTAVLPPDLDLFLVAASRQTTADIGKRPAGDGLVPVDSALGVDADPSRELKVPAAHRVTVYDHDHFDLLSSAEVAAHLQRWLGA
ncbi:MAG: lipase family alpha/beta hydrolase [Pseudomarimonas sp.]